MHPPPPPNLLRAYRLFAIRLPEEYRAWAAEDTTSSAFLTWRIVRTTVASLAFVVLAAVAHAAMFELPSRRILQFATLGAVAMSLLSSRKTLARKALRWQRVNKNGRPVRPKGFTRLGNAEAALLSVVALVLWTSGAAIVGYGRRPPPLTGVAAAKCDDITTTVASRITGGFTTPGTTIVLARAVAFEGRTFVATIVKPPETPGKKVEPQFAAFVNEGDKLYEFELEVRQRDKTREPLPRVTRLTPRKIAPTDPDYAALTRSATCLGEAGRA